MKKRSAYRPKPVNPLAHAWVMSGLLPVNAAKSAMTTLRIQNHGALVALKDGKADLNDIDKLASASNMTLALLEVGGPDFGLGYKPEMYAAADAILAIAQRGGNYLATAEEFSAINTGMDIHEAQLEIATVRQFELALEMEQKAFKTGRGRRVVQE